MPNQIEFFSIKGISVAKHIKGMDGLKILKEEHRRAE
jgi:hypothetical protein